MDKKLDRRTLGVTAAATLASALVSPVMAQDKPRQGPNQAPRQGGHLRVGYQLFPTSLDAILGRSGGDAFYWRQIYDQLVDADQSLNPRAATSLASAWEVSREPPAITFTLREGVTFHDGTAFEAEVVKFNIERVLNPETKATPRASMTAIKSVDVLGKHKVRFNLAQPWGAGLGVLSDRGGVMNSPTAVAALGADYGFKPSATGPFKVAEVVTGSHVRLVRNPNYWGRDAEGNRLPYLDEITIKAIADETVLVSALKAGEIDIAYLPMKDVAAFLSDRKFRITRMDGGGIGYLVTFNMAKPPFDDVNLRLAVAHAIDPTSINEAMYFGKSIIADGGMWPTGTWAYDRTVPRPKFDLAKAREYLKKAGKPGGFAFNGITWTNATHPQSAEIVKAQLAAIGIDMKITIQSVQAATSNFFAGTTGDMFLTSWSRYPEPDWMASLAYRSDGYYNAGKVKRPDVDALVEQGAALYEVAERKKAYRRIDEIVLGEAWFVPLLYAVTYAAAGGRVQNLDTLIANDGKMNLRELWLNA
jgi:peptide/nickel transport system substrate-binding protein